MEPNSTEEQFFDGESLPEEPHFDEEATLLSARPVVPLDRVAAVRLTPPWVFGLALAGALLLGVVTTAIYYSVRYRNESTQLASSDISSGVEAATDPESPNETETADASDSIAVDSLATEESQAVSTPSPLGMSDGITRKRRARFVTRFGGSSAVRTTTGRNAAKEEANTQKREAKFRREKSQSADGLLRIREIFEGAPKP
jgi:hypothetical protein